ncbi:BQ2448_2483 [Microbotryum intermedium]|uniref:Polynucleotide 5'-hydroxyl-kinase GRC3 n=1 Tax=Microbotryum intermedium TaxID=269621 RepID=A0A238FBS8_9BASI|nr:BQ2448_2483 [Microbotryum intermedium]
MAATVVDPPSKRRRTTSDLSSSTSKSTPTAAPMSAVAARRAAAQAQLEAAAAAAAAAMEQPKASTSKLENNMNQSSGDEDEGDDEDHIEALHQVLSSDDDDDDEGNDGQHSSSHKQGRSTNGKATLEKKKKSSKGKTTTKPTRYFAAAAASITKSGDDGSAADRGVATTSNSRESTFVPFDPMDESVDDAAQISATQLRARGKRRREKTAFVDSLCTSTFVPELGTNLFRVSLTAEQTGGEAEEALLFCLRADQMLVFHGVLMVTPIFGILAILNSSLPAPEPSSDTIDLGAVFSNSNHHPIFAPSSHPLPPINPRPYSSRSLRPASLLLPTGQSVDLSPFEAILVVRNHLSGVEGIEPLLKLGGLGCAAGMWEVQHPQGPIKRTRECDGKTWKLVVEPTPSLTLIRSVEGWKTTLAALATYIEPPSNKSEDDSDDEIDEELAYPIPMPSPRLCLLVEGPKRVGKSTFSKLVLHQLLSRFKAVAYLDTDLGQPEFTPPGFVSLNLITSPQFGPNFTHLSVPMAAYFIGSTSPANDPTNYLDAIHKLHDLYEHEVEYAFAEETRSTRRRAPPQSHAPAPLIEGAKAKDRIPLLINTHGWNKGLGLDLLSKLKADVQPTHIFAFDHDQEDDPSGPPTSMGAKGGPIVHRMNAAPPSPLDSKWSSSDLRILQLVSYFNAIFPTPTNESLGSTFVKSWDCSEPLVRRRPIVLDWTTSLSNVSILGSQVDYEQVLYALNGSLVAIVEPSQSPDEEGAPPTLMSNFPYDPLSSERVASSRAHGLALIRSLDVTSKCLHLLTPIPRPQNNRIGLVRGSELDVPVGLLMDASAPGGVEVGVAGVEWKDVPYLSVEGGQGGGRKKVRRNLMRRGQA